MRKSIVIELNDGRIDIINYLKGFSIFTIALMHLIQNFITDVPSSISLMASIGGAGVHVFFLCSGIGLYLSYLKSKTTFVEFLRKRFVKVYIPYILFIFISFLIPWMYQGTDRWQALLSHVFLYKMFIPKYVHSFGYHFWFVSAIIQIYILFIPMCWIKARVNNDKIFAGLFLAISVVWWVVVYMLHVESIRTWSSFCLQYIWEFAIGMCLASYFASGKKIALKIYVIAIVAVIGIAVQAAMALSAEVLKVFNDVPSLIGYLSLAILMYTIPFVRWSGIKISYFSYELYLVHVAVMVTIFRLCQPVGLMEQAAVGIVTIVAAIVIGCLYAKFVNGVVYRKRS